MATKIIKAWIDGAVQEIEVEDIISPEQPLSVEERVETLEGKHDVIITEGNMLVGNGTNEMEEMTPSEVLSHINGASVMTMTTEEFEALEDDNVNANTLYMLTDSEDNVPISADIDDTNMVSFKNANGVVLFTLDLSGVSGDVYFSNVIISSESISVTEGGSNTFTVHLETAPSHNQPVYLAVNDNTRLSVSPSSLIFAPDNYSEPQTVTVTAMQDDDMNDDSVTVTLTSRKVDPRQVVVAIGDDDKPMLVEDGLVLHFDYRGHQDDTSTTITDLASGVTAKNFDKFAKNENGIYGKGTYQYLVLDVSNDAAAAFITAMKNGQGFTTETFGTFSANDFFFGSVLHDWGADNGVNTSSAGMNKNGTSVPRILTDGTSIKTSIDMGLIATIDGEDTKLTTSTYLDLVPNASNYIHIVTTFSPDGTIQRWFNGVPFNPYAVEDFQAWDYDTMFANSASHLPSMRNAYAWADGTHYMSIHRVYSRVLTEDEIKTNMNFEASKMGLTTF